MARAKLYVYKFVTALVAMTMALALSYLGNFNQVNNKAQADNAKNHSMTFATGQEALDSHQLDKCKQSIALLKSSPSGIVAGLALESRMLSKRGHFKEAVALLSQATKKYPNNATLLSERAQVYGYLDDEEKSCDDYIAASKCINMNSDDCLTIVKGLADYEKWNEALAIAQVGIKQKPPSGGLCAQAGDVARRLNKLNLAEELIEKALAIGPVKASTIQELASLHKVMKKWPAVVNDCKRLKKAIPNAEQHITYARCLEMSGEANIELKHYEEAVADFSHAIKISPLKASIFKERALAYEKLGKNDLAKKDLVAAKRIDDSF
ncbi:hypothetical protein KBI23_26600 [bacterium]|nr:hypothetical protein [bacterium]MBP9806952.1 hypothetical protein [bacterium]